MMNPPDFEDITVDPERALLHTLDVAAAMTIAMMRVFFPVDDTRPPPDDRGLYRVHRIIRDATTLRVTIDDYRQHLADLDEKNAGDFPF